MSSQTALNFGGIAHTLSALVEGGDKLTLRQLAVLGHICAHPGPHRVRHIAHAVQVSKPVVTRALNALEKHGLSVRQRSTEDKRDMLVDSTELGRTVHAGVMGAIPHG